MKFKLSECTVGKIIAGVVGILLIVALFMLGGRLSDRVLSVVAGEPPCREVCDRKHIHKRLKESE